MQLDKPAAPVVARQTLVYANQAAATCVLIASPAATTTNCRCSSLRRPTRPSFCVGRPPKPLCMCAVAVRRTTTFLAAAGRSRVCTIGDAKTPAAYVRGITFDTRARRGNALSDPVV